jgi:hypothetical protein
MESDYLPTPYSLLLVSRFSELVSRLPNKVLMESDYLPTPYSLLLVSRFSELVSRLPDKVLMESDYLPSPYSLFLTSDKVLTSLPTSHLTPHTSHLILLTSHFLFNPHQHIILQNLVAMFEINLYNFTTIFSNHFLKAVIG